MIYSQSSRLLFLIVSLVLICCDNTHPELEAVFSNNKDTVRIGGEVCLINLSHDAKYHTLSFGDENAFTERQGVSAHATQIHEKTFYICPVTCTPRFILVGKIRIEVAKK